MGGAGRRRLLNRRIHLKIKCERITTNVSLLAIVIYALVLIVDWYARGIESHDDMRLEIHRQIRIT